jgi:hypothetical protein
VFDPQSDDNGKMHPGEYERTTREKGREKEKRKKREKIC